MQSDLNLFGIEALLLYMYQLAKNLFCFYSRNFVAFKEIIEYLNEN